MQQFMYTSTLLAISAFYIAGCAGDNPGPLPVPVSNASIMSVDDLIYARCTQGPETERADIVVLSFGNINLKKMPEPDEAEDAQSPPLLKKSHPHQVMGTTEVFASHEFVSCKKGRNIRFTSLTYEMKAKRQFSKGMTTPLEVFPVGQPQLVKKIFTSDFSTGIDVTTQPMESTAHITIHVTPRQRPSGKPPGIPMDDERRIFSLIGRFNHEPCATPWADTYITQLGPIEAVDDKGKILKLVKIRNDPFILHIPCDHHD